MWLSRFTKIVDRKARLFVIYFWRILFAKNHHNCAWNKKLRANIFGGFLADQWILYDFDHNDKREYLSEWDWYRSRYINEPFSFLLNNKIVASEMLKQYIRVPENYMLRNGKHLMGPQGKIVDYPEVIEMLKSKERVFIKPLDRGKGTDVTLLSYRVESVGDPKATTHAKHAKHDETDEHTEHAKHLENTKHAKAPEPDKETTEATEATEIDSRRAAAQAAADAVVAAKAAASSKAASKAAPNKDAKADGSSEPIEQIYLNSEPCSEEALIAVLKSRRDWYMSEAVEQDAYAAKLFSKTTNTIRLITLRSPETKEFELFFAVQRIGTEKTIPVDNSSQGGLVAKIDLETGELSRARSLHNLHTYAKHPDSHNQIEGVVIPDWNNIKEQVVQLANRLPYLHFIAWDVLKMPHEICVIEANSSSGVNIIQLWGGQRNQKLGDFYRYHGIIKR
ncbi:MAG: hypothetical protein FWG24_02345 [Eggerthellaceae bacterium]|nr:hypothetical protein [Eggerthellaceae bacterium]